MKRILLNCFILIWVFHCNGQNEPIKCIKTTWKGSNTIQIDSYNENNQRLLMIRIENGDTTQYHRTTFLDSLSGRSYSIKDSYSNPFDYLFFKNERGQVIYTINILNNRNDTTVVPKEELELNEMGDELYRPLFGYIHYSYDEQGNRTSFVATNNDGDTTFSYFMKYDSLNRLSLSEDYEFEENSLVNFYYNDQGLLSKKIRTAPNGDTLDLTENTYDINGFLMRSQGKSYGREWEMNFELVDCNELKN